MPGRASKQPTAEQLQQDKMVKQTAEGIGVEDLSLPKSMVQRLAKGVLAPNTIFSKDAQLAFTRSATVFVNYLANSAYDHAVLAGKKTIQPADVLAALNELEFESFLPRCEAELERYNTIQCDKRNAYRRRVREEAQAAKGEESTTLQTAKEDSPLEISKGALPSSNGNNKRSTDEPSSAKRARMSDGAARGVDDEDTDSNEEEDEDEEEEEEDDDDGDDDDSEAAEFEDAQEQQEDDEDVKGADEDANGGSEVDEEEAEEMQEDPLEEPARGRNRVDDIDDDDDDDKEDDGDEVVSDND